MDHVPGHRAAGPLHDRRSAGRLDSGPLPLERVARELELERAEVLVRLDQELLAIGRVDRVRVALLTLLVRRPAEHGRVRRVLDVEDDHARVPVGEVEPRSPLVEARAVVERAGVASLLHAEVERNPEHRVVQDAVLAHERRGAGVRDVDEQQVADAVHALGVGGDRLRVWRGQRGQHLSVPALHEIELVDVSVVGHQAGDVFAVEQAQELRAARIRDVVQLQADGSLHRVVAAVLQTDRQDVALSDTDRLHVLHRGVRVVSGVGDLDRPAGLRHVDDVDARSGADLAPLAHEGELLVRRDVAVRLLVEWVQPQ